MDRRAITQVVVIVVLACIGARWIPAGPEDLGFGDPLVSWRIDAMLAQSDNPALAKARLMYGRRQRPSLVQHWRLMLTHAAELRARAAAGEVSLIQLAGIPRNDFWFLTYELLPTPVAGTPYEEGSRHDDPLTSGATLFPLGITEDVELAEWDAELRAAEELRKQQPPPEPKPRKGRGNRRGRARDAAAPSDEPADPPDEAPADDPPEHRR